MRYFSGKESDNNNNNKCWDNEENWSEAIRMERRSSKTKKIKIENEYKKLFQRAAQARKKAKFYWDNKLNV